MPLWWYLAAIGVAVLLGAEIHMGYPGVRSWIGYALCVPVAVLALVLLGRTRVRVADGALHVGSACRRSSATSGGRRSCPRPSRQQALGPELDPMAYLMIRAWIRQVVRIEITDPDDPTPYWVFSVRDAPGLLAALKE